MCGQRDRSEGVDADSPEAWLRLALIPGVGPLLLRDLISRFGSAEAVLAASPTALRNVPRLGPKLCRAITNARHEVDVEAEMERCRQHAIEIVAPWNRAYPDALRHIPDPPAVLFTRGDFLPQDGLAVAVVGTRHATHYGRQQARLLAGALASAGVTVVSGLARGIDGEAHRAALEAGGRTVAVLGSGLLDIYPREHRQLAEDIAAQGVVATEACSCARPNRSAFPRRNRIVTGLCQGVVVIEAADRSGALISARLAGEQGREVFAVPGPVHSRTSRGCHQLIRDGAKLVESAADILEELGPLFQDAADHEGRKIHRPAEVLLNDLERDVLEAVGMEPTTIDQVTARSGLPVQRVLSTISVLEMRQMIRRLSGTQIVRS